MKIATIILYYNTPEKTKRCLEACFKSTSVDQKIILVDNNSLERPIDELLSKIKIPENLEVIKNKTNLGFSAGVNTGIKFAFKKFNPKYIAIVNSDLYLKSNALKISIDKLEALEDIFPIGALTGKIMKEDGKTIWQAGGYIKKFSMSGIPKGLNAKDSSAYSQPEFVGWASGAFSVFPSKVLKEIGLFSEDFFFGQEEWDLSLRILKRGLKIYYDPTVLANHSVGGSYKSSHPILNTFNGYCNKVIMARKHFSKFHYILWLIIFECRTILLSIQIAKKHAFCLKDFILQIKAIYLSLLIAPFTKKIKSPLLEKVSLMVGTSKSWPNYWGSMDKPKKSIVVHAGRRDNYQVAISLKNNKTLKYLVTDYYFPKNKFSILLTNIWSKFNPKIKKRIHKDLPSDYVLISKTALLAAILNRFLNFLKIDNHFEEIQDYFLAKKANELALKHNCHIISYSTYASRSFKEIKNKKVLFQMHPYVDFVREKMAKDYKNNPECKSSLKEYEFRIFKTTLKNLRKEPYKADIVVCPSTFCMQSLPKLDKSKIIKKIPYGSRTTSKKYTFKKKKSGFNVVFIGTLCQRKGVLYFLKVAEKLKNHNINFKLISRNINDEFLFNKACNLRNVEVFKDIDLKELENILRDSSIFLFPSLIEGFAHVIVESMHFGLIPIVSPYGCGPDLITNNVNGYIIDPYNIDEMVKKIISLKNNRNDLQKISQNALKTAKNYTEKNFSKNFINFYNEFIG